MITKSGTRPIKKLPRKRYHEEYVCGTGSVPDFNTDAELGMQNQEADNRPTACTSYGFTDARQDVDKVAYDPDYTFAATTFVEGVTPTESGADPLAAGQSTVMAGLLKSIIAPTAFMQESELYIANFSNWQPFLKTAAQQVRNADIHNALGNGTSCKSILNAAFASKTPVCIVTPWYDEWQNAPASGVLPMPKDLTGAGCPWHLHNIKGQKTMAGQELAIDKSWQGPLIGDGGYLYFEQDVLNAVLEQPGTCALIPITGVPSFVAIAEIMLQHTNTITPYFFEL